MRFFGHMTKGSFIVNRFCTMHFGALNGTDFPAMSFEKFRVPTKTGLCFGGH